MIIIGEKINASIPKIKKAIVGRDAGFLKEMAKEQEEAGADVIDVNVGTGEGTVEDEMNDMKWLVNLVKDHLNGQISIDSANPIVLETGLKAGGDKVGFINSVKATKGSIEGVLPLAAKYDVSVIALAMDETGVPNEVSSRVRACEKIMTHVEEIGISPEKVFFDPLVLPVSTDASQGLVTMETLRTIKKEFNLSKTILALSNISFGLPCRTLINIAIANMAMYFEVDALLMNPLDKRLMSAISAGKVVLGKDRYCRKYTQAFRKGILH
jgi:5-methyltetrahydrofolate--homocysteine methyltransferase